MIQHHKQLLTTSQHEQYLHLQPSTHKGSITLLIAKFTKEKRKKSTSAPAQKRKIQNPISTIQVISNILTRINRVVRQIRRTNLRRVPRILRRSSIILRNKSRIHRLRDLKREPTRETLSSALNGVLASICWKGFLVFHAQVEGAVAACSAHCFLGSDGAVETDLASADACLGVAEDEALRDVIISNIKNEHIRSEDGVTYCQHVQNAYYHC